MSTKSKLMLTRQQLAAFFMSDPDAIRVVERILKACDKVEDEETGAGFIKLGDGTMICYGPESPVKTTASVLGLTYYVSTNFVFPVPFIATPLVLIKCRKGGELVWPGSVDSVTALGFTGYMIGSSNTATGYLNYLALGKWK